MSLWQILCCFNSRDNPERQRLLEPEDLPDVPIEPEPRTSEQQIANQNAIRAILDYATHRFVNILSPRPFTPAFERSQTSSEVSSRASSPTPESRDPQVSQVGAYGYTWRVPSEDKVRRIHLGINFDPENGAYPVHDRPLSSHSLRTLPRGYSAVESSNLSHEQMARDGAFSDGSEGGMYGTLKTNSGTWKTAREASTIEEMSGVVKERRSEIRGGVRGLFPIESGAEPQDLEQSIYDIQERVKSFTLRDVGPLVVQLGSSP